MFQMSCFPIKNGEQSIYLIPHRLTAFSAPLPGEWSKCNHSAINTLLSRWQQEPTWAKGLHEK